MSKLLVDEISDADNTGPVTVTDGLNVSSGNVGIGTTSPSFESGTGTGLEINNSSGNGAHVKLTDVASGSGGTNGFDLYAFNTSGYIENYEAGSIVFRNGGTERMRINPSGNLAFPTGKGIDFSAVTGGSGTATSNVLSDYEEGTFVPALAYSIAGTASFTYNAQVGHYVKVGDIVHFQLNVRLDAFTKGTASGTPLVTGLPFTSHNTGGYAGAVVCITLNGWTFTSVPIASVVDNTSFAGITTLVSNSGAADIADPDSNSMIWVTGTYRAA